MNALMRIQTIDPTELPVYDHTLLMREMELFRDWFLGKHLQIAATSQQHAVLERTFARLIELAYEQPQVFVHRDYHSRNLMVTRENNPGILDYQDAVRGPLTYDLVSLLRDSYIAWPKNLVIDWALKYRDQIVTAGTLTPTSDEDFIRWFDLMGVQRQLKVCGIFARLYYRDGKPTYLRDIPLTFRYLMDASARHQETEELHAVLSSMKLHQKLSQQAPR
jgi:aminoglycoside/choline kinase family phosphotransferase